MIKSLCLFFLLIFVSHFVLANSQRLFITVINQNSQAVPDATILLKGPTFQGSKEYKTDTNGKVDLLDVEAGQLYITVKHIDYVDTAFSYTFSAKDQMLRIVLTQRVTELSEVKIIAQPPVSIKKDTLEYLTKYFKNGNEETLEDLAKKLPGLELNEKGEIIFKGKKIDKITVDGRDFFGSNVKMATKNIPASIIEKLQVIENFSDHSTPGNIGNNGKNALNIVLDESKKNIVFGELNYGSDWSKYQLADLKAFYFNKRFDLSLINNYNNVGKEIFSTEDYLNFYGGVQNVVQSGSAEQALKLPSLLFSDRDKAFVNKSLINSVNLNYKPHENLKMNAFGIFSGNNSQFQSRTLSSFLNNNNFQLDENELSTLKKDIAIGQVNLQYTPSSNSFIKYNLNHNYFNSRHELFLSSQLLENSFDVWSNARNSSNTNTQQLSVHQTLSPSLIVSGLFNYEFRTTQQRYITREGGAQILGEMLDLQRSDLAEISQGQWQTGHRFDAQVSFYKKFSRNDHLKWQIGYSGSADRFRSAILLQDTLNNLISNSAENLKNENLYKVSDKNIGLYYIHQSGIFNYSTGLSTHLYNFFNLTNRYFVQPDVSAKIRWKDSRQLSANYRIDNKLPNIYDLSKNDVIEDYRTVHVGSDSLKNSLFHTFSANYFDINLYSFTHLNLYISYSRKIRNIRNSTDLNTFGQILNPGNNSPENTFLSHYNFSKKFSRYFEFKVLGSAILNNFNYRLGNEIYAYNSFEVDQTLSCSSSIKKDFTLEAGIQHKNDHYRSNIVSSTFRTLRPFVNIECYLRYAIKVKAEYSLYSYQQLNVKNANRYSVLNASLQKKIKKITIEISGRNLFDATQVYRNSFNENRFSTSNYRILPRNLLFSLAYRF